MSPGATYSVYAAQQALRDIAGISEPDRTRIWEAIDGLAADPRPHGCKKLKGKDAYRIRVGDWRVIYVVDDKKKNIIISRVKRRNEDTY